MKKSKRRRDEIVESLADQVLAHGLEIASLRPLAAAIGTSDRMLLYYFTDKSELLSAVLVRIAERLAAMLDRLVEAGPPQPADELTSQVWHALRQVETQPYMRIWLELAGRAARNEEPYKAIGTAIAQGFLDWCGARLSIVPGEDAVLQAGRVLALIEGFFVLEAFDLGQMCNEIATVKPAKQA